MEKLIRPAAVKRERDFVRVSGSDSESYLQGQLSQDLAGMKDGESKFSFILQPSGKVEAWVRITRVLESNYLIDVDPGFGELVFKRLKRFLLRTDATVEPENHNLVTFFIEPPNFQTFKGFPISFPWRGLEVVDLLYGENDFLEGVDFLESKVWEECRIREGIPVMGKEITDSTIPASLGVTDSSVSFTKGCYTGQELVARIDSRSGGTPYRLVKALGDSQKLSLLDSVLRKDGLEVGQVTSSTSNEEGFVALAFLKRGVEIPTEAEILCADSLSSKVFLEEI